MRILRLIPYFTDTFGGPVHHVKMVTKELERLGHETVVYTTNLADKNGQIATFNKGDFDVRAFPVQWSVGDYFYTPGMKAALKQEDFDIVHAHCYRNYQSDLAAWISWETRKPLIFTAHGTLVKLPGLRDKMLKGFYDALSRGRVLNESSRVIALSLREMNQYRSWNVPHGKIVRIYHGIDADLFRPLDNGHVVREEIGLGSGPVILYVGRIHERKGLQYLIPAFQDVLTEFPTAKLVICGPDYGYRKELTRQVAGTPARNGIVLTGEVEPNRMPLLYGASDIVVLPARHEVFGHVLAEAASCGKAIVATKWGWAAEFFENRKDCMFVDGYGNVPALAEILLTLLRDSDLREGLGARAREKVLRNLSWRACALNHIKIYEQALANA